MRKKQKRTNYDQPLCHPDHPRPVTRRQFLAQGFLSGLGLVTGSSIFSLFANPRAAQAALSPDLEALKASCGIAVQGAGKIPFIAFDLAGGANMAGSNALIGQEGGQLDFLTTDGYRRQGLPADMTPAVVNPVTGTNDFVNTDLGLAFHSDSAFLRGILSKVDPANLGNINGAVIPARSDNDTGNNPHNPMYGIAQAGADGELLTLIGSENSPSGGNSQAPMEMIDPTLTPTKVDRTSDVTGLVDTGKLVGLLAQSDAVAVMESIQRISSMKLGSVDTMVTADDVIKDLVNCGYVKAADLSDRFGDPSALNPELDMDILGGAGIFSQTEFDNEREFRKTAAVMKMVVSGLAGAGTIEMGGYDYHGGARAEGEVKDFRAGQCMGACLEYAARIGVPVMLYIFSDGSLTSDGTIDNSVDGRGKGEWTSDNSSTAASIILVYSPDGRPQLFTGDNLGPERHQQIGFMRADGSVETGATPVAANVNLLAQAVIMNYMALHDDQAGFEALFPNHGLGNAALRDSLTCFDPIVNGVIGG